jgi:hypothetical protein
VKISKPTDKGNNVQGLWFFKETVILGAVQI